MLKKIFAKNKPLCRLFTSHYGNINPSVKTTSHYGNVNSSVKTITIQNNQQLMQELKLSGVYDRVIVDFSKQNKEQLIKELKKIGVYDTVVKDYNSSKRVKSWRDFTEGVFWTIAFIPVLTICIIFA